MIDENREKMSDILDNFSPFCTGEKLSGEMLSGHRKKINLFEYLFLFVYYQDLKLVF